MKIMSIIATWAPHSFGGAEVSASNLSRWLMNQGHTMAVLTSADDTDEEWRDHLADGRRIWRFRWPRRYTFWQHEKASRLQKLIWHLQDHFDPRNRSLVGKALDEFKPDVCLIHVVSGMGYNGLYELAKRDIPAVYFMHDLNIACGKGSLFKNGKDCETQCLGCKASSHIRFAAATSLPRMSFCANSRANLERASKFMPIKQFNHAAIFNANIYPKPTVERQASEEIRLLFVGRIHSVKGIPVLLDALSGLADKFKFSITILGKGPEEESLRATYGHLSWCRFMGHVSQEEVSNYMQNTDLLCVPSVWAEPLGGVVVQALQLGLPVFGSNKGGIPELVEHDKNGQLLPPGDMLAWREALQSVFETPTKLDAWRSYAKETSSRFDQDVLGGKIFKLIEETIALPPRGKNT